MKMNIVLKCNYHILPKLWKGITLIVLFSKHCSLLKGVLRPEAFAIVCLSFCEYCTVSYSGSCVEQVADSAQGILVFTPLKIRKELLFYGNYEP